MKLFRTLCLILTVSLAHAQEFEDLPIQQKISCGSYKRANCAYGNCIADPSPTAVCTKRKDGIWVSPKSPTCDCIALRSDQTKCNAPNEPDQCPSAAVCGLGSNIQLNIPPSIEFKSESACTKWLRTQCRTIQCGEKPAARDVCCYPKPICGPGKNGSEVCCREVDNVPECCYIGPVAPDNKTPACCTSGPAPYGVKIPSCHPFAQ